MGCSDSKDAFTPEIQPSGALNTMSQEAKSRLEWKMCQVSVNYRKLISV